MGKAAIQPERIPFKPKFSEDDRPLAFLAFLKFAIHLAGITHYGFFRDELYYLACGHHMAWGYVDQPPFVAAAAWLSRHAFGSSLVATRLLPAAAGALLVFLTGLLARALGGGRTAQLLAATAILLAPAVLAMSSFLSMNAFEPVFWTLAALLLATILRTGDSQLWIWFGLVAGIALLNKHTTLVFGFAVVAGLVLTSARREFAKQWIWLGGFIAFAIFLPNLIWEAQHQWPQIEVVRNAQMFKTNAISPLEYLWQEILFVNPVALPIAATGLGWYFAGEPGKNFRPLGWAFIGALALFAGLHGKTYYLLPALPIVMAAGGVALEQIFVNRARWAIAAYASALVISGVATLPFGVPLLSVPAFLRYEKILPMARNIHTERDSTSELPQLYADMMGWREMTATVAQVFYSLPLEERSRCAVFAGNYGEAGAIDQFGPQFGLPRAISPHNNYFLWGPRGYTGECVILFGERAEIIKQFFADVQPAATITNRYAMQVENGLTVYLCRKPQAPLAELWPRFRLII